MIILNPSHTHSYLHDHQVLSVPPRKSPQNLLNTHNLVHLSPPAWTIIAASLDSDPTPSSSPGQSQGPTFYFAASHTLTQEAGDLASSRVTSVTAAVLLPRCSSGLLWTKAFCPPWPLQVSSCSCFCSQVSKSGFGGRQAVPVRGEAWAASAGRSAEGKSSQDPFLPGDPFWLHSLVLPGREAESGAC